MKYFVIGGSGMVGHTVFLYLHSIMPGKVSTMTRSPSGIDVIDKNAHYASLEDFNNILHYLESIKPCVVINCAAILQGEFHDFNYVNSVIPHLLAKSLSAFKDGSRLIQISTDGVFSGSRGSYTEKDIPDAIDPYGKSKIAGEVLDYPHVTIRTSVIGRELARKRGLLEWLLSQKESARGFRNVMWSGVTTLELAKFIAYLVPLDIFGIIHFPGEKISKYALLELIKQEFKLPVDIIPVDTPALDRSLITIRKNINYQTLPTKVMIRELYNWGNRSGI